MFTQFQKNNLSRNLRVLMDKTNEILTILLFFEATAAEFRLIECKSKDLIPPLNKSCFLTITMVAIIKRGEQKSCAESITPSTKIYTHATTVLPVYIYYYY